MVNDECKKYPIGTKIKFIGVSYLNDGGKVGSIVGYCGGFPLIFLPESTHISDFSTQLIPATWQTGWEDIEVLSQKNQQLLFAFME